MPRRKSHKSASKSTFWSNFFILVLALITLLGAIFLFFRLNNKPICANSISCVGDLSGNYVEGKTSTFLGRVVTAPSYIAQVVTGSKVLAATTSGEKHIFVDLSTQTLKAYEGENLIYSFPVSTGKWHPTPTGDFRIWVKLRYAHMEGGEGADYYNLYNVPYTMFFYSDQVPKSMGFSLHGAYWHNNFGHPMSHGCVNIRPEDAAKLYDWASPATTGSTTYATVDDPGTLVTIYGTPPAQ